MGLKDRLFSVAGSTQEYVWSSGITVGGIACFLLSFSGACVKLLHGHLPILEICLFRSGIAWLSSIVISLATNKRPLFGHLKNAHYLVSRGVCGSCAVFCNYTSVTLLPLGTAVTLNTLKPCMVAFAAWLFLHEPLGLVGCFGLLISIIGAVLVAHPPFLFGGHADWGPPRLVGTLAALLASVFAAGVAFAIRRIGKSEAALTVALAFHSCTLAMSTPPLALSWPDPPVAPTTRQAGLLVAIAATSFSAQVLMTRSFQLLPAGQASAMSSTSIIYGHILGLLLFGEHPTLMSAVGTLVIMGGVLLTTARRGAKPAGSSGAGNGCGDDAKQGFKQQQQQEQELVAVAGVGGDVPREWLGPGAASVDADGVGREEEGDEEAPLLGQQHQRQQLSLRDHLQHSTDQPQSQQDPQRDVDKHQGQQQLDRQVEQQQSSPPGQRQQQQQHSQSGQQQQQQQVHNRPGQQESNKSKMQRMPATSAAGAGAS